MPIQTRKQARRSVRAIRFRFGCPTAVFKLKSVRRFVRTNYGYPTGPLHELVVVKGTLLRDFPYDGSNLAAFVNKYWLFGLKWQCIGDQKISWGKGYDHVFWLKRR